MYVLKAGIMLFDLCCTKRAVPMQILRAELWLLGAILICMLNVQICIPCYVVHVV
jgi:hypothetical protein